MNRLTALIFIYILNIVFLHAQENIRVRPEHICLNITEHPESQQSVTWRTQSSDNNELVVFKEYSADDNTSDTIHTIPKLFSADDGDWYYYEALLKNLQPESHYSYKVGSGDSWTGWYSFTTACSSEKDFSFLYFGDVQREIATIGKQNINAAITSEPQSSFLLFAGDLVNNGEKNNGEWNDFFYAGDSVFQYYPVFAVTGNHEHSTRRLRYQPDVNWYYHFALPKNGPKGSKEETYYFDYNQARFISLNTSTFINNPFTKMKTKHWLKHLLKESEGKWIIVSHHHPVYSTKADRRNKSLERTLKPLYEKYGVALVLTGHDHTYGRGMSPGTLNPVYVVSDAGGKYYNIGISPWMHRAGSNITTYQVIKVTPRVIHYKSYLLSGGLYDEFEIKRNKNELEVVDLQDKAIEEKLDLPQKYIKDYSPEQLIEYRTMIETYQNKKVK